MTNVEYRNGAVLIDGVVPNVEIFPKHVVLERDDGRVQTAIRHGLDESIVLNNMGFTVDTPMLHGAYSFTGRWTPYRHQKITSDFLASHPRAFVLSGLGCVDADTEYLSPTGWVRIASYTGGRVMQYDPATGRASFVEPLAYVRLPETTMLHFHHRHGLDQVLSAEHRMLLQETSGGGRKWFVPAGELADDMRRRVAREPFARGEAKNIRSFAPTTYVFDGDEAALTDDELRLMVAVCADGHITNQRTNHTIVRLKKERKKLRMRALLASCGVDYREREPEHAGALGFSVFVFHWRHSFKRFPEWMWTMSRRQLTIVAEEALLWDGSYTDRVMHGRSSYVRQFFSSVRSNADLVQHAMISAGGMASVTCGSVNRPDGFSVHWQPDRCGVGFKGASAGGVLRCNVSDVPTTDGFKYCFAVPSGALVLRRNGRVFCTGNSGKSSAALWAIDYLMLEKKVRKTLIVTPLSTVEAVWANEVFTTLPHRSCSVAVGTTERKLQILAGESDIFVINHDGIKNDRVLTALKKPGAFDLIVVDEFTAFKDHKTDRYKALKQIVGDRRLWMMSGTPAVQRPTDVWAPSRIINPAGTPSSFVLFRDATMQQTSRFKWVPRADAVAVVNRTMQPAVFFRKEDCIDLPPVVHIKRPAVLTPIQRRLVKELTTRWAAEHDAGKITASNAAIRIGKLFQVMQGAVIGNDGSAFVVDAHPREDVLLELIAESSSKSIVFAPYIAVIDRLREVVGRHYSVKTITGSVTSSDRAKIIGEFQNGGLEVIIAHPRTASHGLTLTAASTTVWYGPIFQNEAYVQANARMDRPGQLLSMTIAHIHASKLEEVWYDNLVKGNLTNDEVLNTYARLVDGA